MTTDKKKSIILFGKGVNALTDGVFPIADSFFDEAIRYDSNFAEAYLMKAIIERAKLPQVLNSSIELKDVQPYFEKAYLLNNGLEFAIGEIINGNLNYKNVNEWLNGNKQKNDLVIDLSSDERNGWESARITERDHRVWRKDKFEAWIKIDELNKQTEYGWKIRINQHNKEVNAWHWKNLTEISGDNIIQKITSAGNTNIEKSKGCYIASVCYGSYECEEVIILKKYRDDILINYAIGKIFIDFYYLISPKFVGYLYNKPKLNKIIKEIIIQPIVIRLKSKKEL